MVGVSFDPVAANCAFAEKRGFDYALLSDTDRQLGLAYGAATDAAAGFARRVSFLIDEEGIIRKTYPQVNPGAHPDEVLRDLDALGGGAPAGSGDPAAP